MIMHLGEQAKLRLLVIINLSWSGGRLPQNWKKATILPIRKLDKKATSPESFRPIALTNIPCKIREKIILTRLLFHLTSKNLLPKEEFAYQRRHSTTDQVLYLCQRESENPKILNLPAILLQHF
ncbi:putative RNA-directed DNA polymerase from transposon BS [Trichonephila clavipes]|nr:putative RNA-directed DNA polymerase from transposon BS [Trichonephila clavipes]